MDISKNRDKYLSVLYLKTNADYASGYDETKLRKLVNVNIVESNNVKNYLRGKKLIEDELYDGQQNVTLTSDGIDYCLKLKENKTFKIIGLISYCYKENSITSNE